MRTTPKVFILVTALAVCWEPAAAATVQLESVSAFAARCKQETLRISPNAARWVDKHCAEKRKAADAAGPMLDILLRLAPATGAPVPSLVDAKAALGDIRWRKERSGAQVKGSLGELTVALNGSARAITGISFNWQKTGAKAPYNIIEALKIRGIVPETLGCPRYPMASAGQEKVMRVAPPGKTAFTLVVYDRAAPTGSEWGIHEVDADIGGTIPTQAQLREGAYPGGGGRAWAPEATGWVTECPDPE